MPEAWVGRVPVEVPPLPVVLNAGTKEAERVHRVGALRGVAAEHRRKAAGYAAMADAVERGGCPAAAWREATE